MTLRLLLSNVFIKAPFSHKGNHLPRRQERMSMKLFWEKVNTRLPLRSTGQRGKVSRSTVATLVGLLFCAEL